MCHPGTCGRYVDGGHRGNPLLLHYVDCCREERSPRAIAHRWSTSEAGRGPVSAENR
ncbi:hypothetical protein BN2537_12365 [Streptomyces venezuelae]|nr:hypothetical protein BN2537_12365 [Streptomyces venezuelae]